MIYKKTLDILPCFILLALVKIRLGVCVVSTLNYSLYEVKIVVAAKGRDAVFACPLHTLNYPAPQLRQSTRCNISAYNTSLSKQIVRQYCRRGRATCLPKSVGKHIGSPLQYTIFEVRNNSHLNTKTSQRIKKDFVLPLCLCVEIKRV